MNNPDSIRVSEKARNIAKGITEKSIEAIQGAMDGLM
jgi:hypothetical protein